MDQPLHAALTDTVPLGKIKQLHASPTRLDQLTYHVLAESINDPPRLINFRSRPGAALSIFSRAWILPRQAPDPAP
jgi:hypothetical protein